LDAAETSKAQRLAKSAGDFDEIVAWLDWEFAKHDNNKDGFLDYHEFVRFIRSLNLNMTMKEVSGGARVVRDLHPNLFFHSHFISTLGQIFQFFLLADRDNDYRIVWCEIEQDVPRILSKIYEGIPEGPSDWCLMSGKEGGKEGEVWYFNKRTSDVRKQTPIELGDGGGEYGIKENVKMGQGGRKEAVLENTKTLDVALTWLDWEFKKADFDKNGVLSHHEFMAFVLGLRLGLNEKEVSSLWGMEEGEGRRERGEREDSFFFLICPVFKTHFTLLLLFSYQYHLQVEQFTSLADSNGDGMVEWTEVLELTPLILRKLYTALPPGPHDWCAIIDAEENEYYLNKRTGLTVSTRPPDYVPVRTETEEGKAEGGEA